MKPEEFKDYQRKFKLTNLQMSRVLCCSLSHVEHMRMGFRKVARVYKKIIKLRAKKLSIK